MRFLPYSILSLLAAVALSACGGGGGGGGFEAAERLEAETPHEDEADSSHALALVINDSGTGASAFGTYDFFESNLSIRPYAAETGFGEPIPVHVGDGAVVDSGRGLAVNDTGLGVVAWRVLGRFHDVAAVRTLDARTGALGAPHTLDASEAESLNPTAVIDAAGRVIVAWRQRVSGGDMQLYGAAYEPLTGWGTSFRLEPLGGDVYGYDPAISPDGHEGIGPRARRLASCSRSGPRANRREDRQEAV